MKRKILFFLLCLLPFMSYAQLQGTYSKYVGEYQDLEVSTAASQIYSIDWKKWSGDVECVTLIQNWGNDATVHIDEYFTGTIRIRAQYKTMSNAIKTEYFDIRCNAVTLSPSPSSISLSKVGETEFITYTKSPSNKFPTVEYSSSNPNVATVGVTGLVTAVSKGTTTITLKNSMGPNATVSVSVAGTGPTPTPDPDPTPNPDDEDTYTQLTAEEGDRIWVCSTKLNNEKVYIVKVPPFLASGSSCVAKSTSGKVTIPSGWGGTSVRKIEAYAFNYISGITEVVIPSTVKYIDNNSFAYCSSLKTITCYAAEPPTGSSLNHISTYDSETTLYVPSATAKAKYQNAPGWCNFKEVKVIGESDPIVPASISVSPSTKTIEVGDGFNCSYTISPSNANSQTSVTWTSDDSSIASVSSSGYVTGKKAGKTYINATTANGKTNWCTVTVTSPTPSTIVPTSISVSPSTKTIEVGDGFYCSYTISPSNANSQTSVTWSSDDSSIATVSSSGYVTGKKAGSTYINAKTANGKENWCKVTVTSSTPSTIVPTSISVSPSTKTIDVGDGFYCSYTISPSNANSQTSVTWSSDDNSIASVSTSGYVTGKKAGSTYINATTANGKSNWCKVTVEDDGPIYVTSISLNETWWVLPINGSKSLSATVYPSNATNKSVTWSSSNESVARVNNGKITAIKEGFADITCTAKDGSGVSASCTICVNYGEIEQIKWGTGDGMSIEKTGTVKKNQKILIAASDWGGRYIPDCTYYYTLDGSTPTKSSSHFTANGFGTSNSSIVISKSCVLKAFATCDGYKDSKVNTWQFTVEEVESYVEINGKNFPDATFRSWLLSQSYGSDGKLTESEIRSVTSINVSGSSSSPGTIKSLKGIEYFTSLKTLNSSNNQLTSLDVSKNTALESLWCYGNCIVGVEMDNLISGLPRNNTDEVYRFSVVGENLANEGNVCTTAQVAAVKAKGWFPCYYDSTIEKYVEYEGSTDVFYYDVNTSSFGYASFYHSQSAYSLPYGLSAQVVTKASNGKLTYKTIADGSVSGVIPAGTAVMLVSDNKQSGTYTLTSTESKASYSGTNLLQGSDAATTTTGDGHHYKLSYGQPGSNLSNVFGWYWGAQNGAPFQIEGHKAWLVVPKSSSSTRGFAIGGEATGIEMVSGDDEADAVYYDLQGRRVTKPTVKGVYIKNGKKVMVK